MFKYAILNAQGVVVGISYLSGEVDKSDMILLSDDCVVDFGWQYIDGQWHEPDPENTEDTPEQQLDPEELDRLLIMEALVVVYEEVAELKEMLAENEVTR